MKLVLQAETICTAPEGAQLPARHASMQAPALSSSSRPLKRTFSAMELLFAENEATKEDEQLGLALPIFAQLELFDLNLLDRQASQQPSCDAQCPAYSILS